jgi:hypothetical protein
VNEHHVWTPILLRFAQRILDALLNVCRHFVVLAIDTRIALSKMQVYFVGRRQTETFAVANPITFFTLHCFSSSFEGNHGDNGSSVANCAHCSSIRLPTCFDPASQYRATPTAARHVADVQKKV